MKNLKKNLLKFDKEVISSLSENDLISVRGGGFETVNPNSTCWTCPQLVTKDDKECISWVIKCQDSEGLCLASATCPTLLDDKCGVFPNPTSSACVHSDFCQTLGCAI